MSEKDSKLVFLYEPDWYGLLESWGDLVSRCSRKPSRKRIHALRIATLRLKAQTECWLTQHGEDGARTRAARRWVKQAEKLRKVMSSVRDLDVFLETVQGLRSPEAPLPADAPVASRIFVEELDRLERRLKRKRIASEKRLVASVSKRSSALQEACAEMQAHFRVSEPPSIDIGKGIREIVGALAAEAPSLSAETLHEFRKRAKAARYLAEIRARSDRLAGRQVVLLKKIQEAVGRWHDWMSLAERAHRILDGRGEESVTLTLESMAERAFLEAVRSCRSVTAQLVALEAREIEPSVLLPPKKPVGRAGTMNPDLRRQA